MSNAQNALTQRDLEEIERIINKNSDDLAISIARAFERLEEHIDGNAGRIYSRLADIEGRVEEYRLDVADLCEKENRLEHKD
jgi:hypothetical protein